MLPWLALSLLSSTCDAPGPIGEMDRGFAARSLSVTDGTAVLRVRADFVLGTHGEDSVHGQGSLTIPLPAGEAVVIGAGMSAGGRERALTLMDADAAEIALETFRRALEYGVPREEARAGRDRTAAVVSIADRSTADVVVQVVTACSAPSVSVWIDVLLASAPVDGGWRFLLPRPQLIDASELSAPLRITGDATDAAVDGHVSAQPRIREGTELAPVDVWPRGDSLVRARVGRARIVPQHAPRSADAALDAAPADEAGAPEPLVAPIDVLRAEVDLPRPLARAPDGLHLVFVVDASVSAGEGGRDAALAQVDLILDAAPADARWALIAVGRTPRVAVPPWRGRDERAVPRIAIENGSDLAAALARAAILAGDVEGVGRIIVLSDLVAPSEARTVASALARAPLTHVIELPQDMSAEDAIGWRRVFADDAGLDDVAAVEATGGIYVSGFGDEAPAALAAHLIAPTRVDRPALTVGGVALALDDLVRDVRLGPDDQDGVSDDDALPEQLFGGQGIRAEIVLPPDARRGSRARLTGFLWSERMDVELVRSARLDRIATALAAHGEISPDLDDTLVRGAALAVGAVSRTTSFAFIPQWQPATDDLLGMSGCGCCCGCGCMGSGRSCSGTRCGMGRSVDLREREVLEGLLQQDLDRCDVPVGKLSVEFADLEILAVRPLDATARCVSERFWLHRLDVDVEADRVPGAFESRRTLQIEARASSSEPLD